MADRPRDERTVGEVNRCIARERGTTTANATFCMMIPQMAILIEQNVKHQQQIYAGVLLWDWLVDPQRDDPPSITISQALNHAHKSKLQLFDLRSEGFATMYLAHSSKIGQKKVTRIFNRSSIARTPVKVASCVPGRTFVPTVLTCSTRARVPLYVHDLSTRPRSQEWQRLRGQEVGPLRR